MASRWLPMASGTAWSRICARLGDDARAADRVVAGAARRAAVLGDGVGAVQRVVQAAPARVRGIQRIARVGHRHDELRAGDAGDLGIDVVRADREVRRLWLQIADAAQEFRIGAGSIGLPGVPGARRRSVAAARRACRAVPCCAAPDRGSVRRSPARTGRLDAGAGDRLSVDEVVQRARQPAGRRRLCSPFRCNSAKG